MSPLPEPTPALLPLPCPFCGSSKITVEWEHCEPQVTTDTNRRWFAECTQCSCQGPFCQKEPEVIPAWNSRTPSKDRELLAEAGMLLVGAVHALRSYQHGNDSPDLAEHVAGNIERFYFSDNLSHRCYE